MAPNGTPFAVRIEQTVRTAQLQQGTLLSGVLNNDVRTNGNVIPAGSRVQMKVYSQQGQPVDLRLDSIAVNGQS